MNWKSWLNKKFVEWRGESRRATQKEFSDWIGIDDSTMSIYLLEGKIPKQKKIIDKFVKKFGLEVYEVLQIEPPEITSTSYLPPEFRERLEAALFEAKSELELAGLSTSDPEAEETVTNIFSKHGFKYTRTIKS